MDFKVYTKQELHEEYGYLMDKKHGKDTELLIDILKETGLIVNRIGRLYILNKRVN